MRHCRAVRGVLITGLFVLSSACGVEEASPLEGTWSVSSYRKADTQIRYETDGYMMFGKSHWLHVQFFNRDERPQDFSEAHHGTYAMTGSATLDMGIDMELHMDPKSEYQETPVWYGDPVNLTDVGYRVEGNSITIDFPSTAQIVLERLE